MIELPAFHLNQVQLTSFRNAHFNNNDGYIKSLRAMKYSNITVVFSIIPILSIISLLVVFPPVKVAFADYNFGAAGDWGCSSNTNTVENGIAAKNTRKSLRTWRLFIPIDSYLLVEHN